MFLSSAAREDLIAAINQQNLSVLDGVLLCHNVIREIEDRVTNNSGRPSFVLVNSAVERISVALSRVPSHLQGSAATLDEAHNIQAALSAASVGVFSDETTDIQLVETFRQVMATNTALDVFLVSLHSLDHGQRVYLGAEMLQPGSG